MSGMDPMVINNYCSKIPSEIRDAVKPLNCDKAWAIYAAVLEHEQLSFGEIRGLFNANSSGDIGKYLVSLSVAGLIRKETRHLHDVGDEKRSKYIITPIGKNLIRSFYTGILNEPFSEPIYPIATISPVEPSYLNYSESSRSKSKWEMQNTICRV